MRIVDVAGVRLALLAERAAYLPDFGTLLVADVHIGKAVSFRRLGVPVPQGTTSGTLARLSAAIRLTGARQVVFLGDLLHSARSGAPQTFDAVRRWRDEHAAVELTLVRGNHDRHAGDPPEDWNIRSVDAPLRLGPLALLHQPQQVDGAYALAGHLHPSAVVGGRAHDHLRLPCFHFGEFVGVLPAFGDFTGSHTLPRSPGDRVFVIAGDEVRSLPVVLNTLAG